MLHNFCVILCAFKQGQLQSPAAASTQTAKAPHISARGQGYYVGCDLGRLIVAALKRSSLPQHISSPKLHTAPINYLVAIFAHRPTASFASQICCFFAWICSFYSPLAHKTTKTNQKEYVFRIMSVAKFVILYYIYNTAVFATLQKSMVVLHQEPIR